MKRVLLIILCLGFLDLLYADDLIPRGGDEGCPKETVVSDGAGPDTVANNFAELKIGPVLVRLKQGEVSEQKICQTLDSDTDYNTSFPDLTGDELEQLFNIECTWTGLERYGQKEFNKNDKISPIQAIFSIPDTWFLPFTKAISTNSKFKALGKEFYEKMIQCRDDLKVGSMYQYLVKVENATKDPEKKSALRDGREIIDKILEHVSEKHDGIDYKDHCRSDVSA